MNIFDIGNNNTIKAVTTASVSKNILNLFFDLNSKNKIL